MTKCFVRDLLNFGFFGYEHRCIGIWCVLVVLHRVIGYRFCKQADVDGGLKLQSEGVNLNSRASRPVVNWHPQLPGSQSVYSVPVEQ